LVLFIPLISIDASFHPIHLHCCCCLTLPFRSQTPTRPFTFTVTTMPLLPTAFSTLPVSKRSTSIKLLMKKRKSFMPTKSTFRAGWCKVGTNSVSRAELSNSRRNCPEIQKKEAYGQPVSVLLVRWKKFVFSVGSRFAKCQRQRLDIVWMLGNLARATYVGSSDFVWPYSYNQCDTEHRQSQEINACDVVNHYGLAPSRGRGAPEIDVIEAMQGEPGKLPSTHIQRPYQSTSLQVAPGIEIDRPVLGRRPHPVSPLRCSWSLSSFLSNRGCGCCCCSS
jgi:Beta-glucan synthesis-associated protein SKN1/KRE6/Sbg1